MSAQILSQQESVKNQKWNLDSSKKSFSKRLEIEKSNQSMESRVKDNFKISGMNLDSCPYINSELSEIGKKHIESRVGNEMYNEKELVELHKQYQLASISATAVFNSARSVFSYLSRHKLTPKRKQAPLLALEIGAINAQLHVKWMEVHGIDLVSRHPAVKQIDFFKYNCEAEKYDVVVNSMVLNSFFEPERRGLMLRMCWAHLKLGGLFFFNLPLRCIESKFLNRNFFLEMMEIIGFQLKEEKNTPKLGMYVFEKQGTIETAKIKTKSRSDLVFVLDIDWPVLHHHLLYPKQISKNGTDFAISFNTLCL